MSTKLPKKAMNLKQFLIRQEVLKLYRNIFRSIRQVPDERTRKDLAEWARADFRNNMHQTEEFVIKGQLLHGERSLATLQKNLGLAVTHTETSIANNQEKEGTK